MDRNIDTGRITQDCAGRAASDPVDFVPCEFCGSTLWTVGRDHRIRCDNCRLPQSRALEAPGGGAIRILR